MRLLSTESRKSRKMKNFTILASNVVEAIWLKNMMTLINSLKFSIVTQKNSKYRKINSQNFQTLSQRDFMDPHLQPRNAITTTIKEHLIHIP